MLLAGVTAVMVLSAAPARAQGFIVPYIGANFGGDSGCQRLADCEEKTLNFGVALGSLGGPVGFEEDIGYARGFFGDIADGGSSVFVLMSNVMIGVPAGPIRPYVVGGLGLIKSHVDFDVSSLVSADDNNLGYDLGGGLTIAFGDHVGVRGDLRRFRTFGDVSLGGLPISGESLDFWRAAGGLYLGF
jgi:opacity protein-like surface antigen